MIHRSRGWFLILPLLLVLASGSIAFAQGGATSSLAGTVTDSTGGVVPGADIVVKNNATGAVYTAVSGRNGGFTIPSLPPGTYTATVSLLGFKTVVLNDVTLNVGVPASVKAVLQPGDLQETVVVAGATDVIQTQATSVATTMNARQIANLPAVGRAAFDLVSFTPGVVTGTGSIRDSSVNGLPQAAVNITLDGMNIQDNYAKTWDGMFTRVNPRIDAIEEVTVSSAAQGADMAGQGGVQIRFVTRSGSNNFQGSLYYYLRREWMNSNTWFNTHFNVKPDGTVAAKPPTNYRYPGGRLGGPVTIPGLFNGRDKLFFFVNYELVDNPGTVGNYRTIMSEASQNGIFQYGSGRSVNLWQLAAQNGQTATPDPLIAKLLADVRSATSALPVNPTNDPLTQQVYYQQPTKSRTHYPTVRIDYNVTSKHRATFSTTRNILLSNPDTTNSRQTVFPGFPVRGLQDSKRYTWQGNLRSVLTKNLVNDFRIGGTGGATLFSPDMTPAMFNASGAGNMGGYGLNWSGFKNINNLYQTASFSAREGSTKVFEDTVSWLKNKHSLGFGASATRGDVWLKNRQLVPTLTMEIPSGDPADAMFSPANFPGASGSDLTNAKYLYAVLTGRISSIGREARIGGDGDAYNILGESYQQGRMWDLGVFVQDSWRWTPTLTINGGVRYAVQLPFYALNNSYSTATLDDVFGITGTGSGFVLGSVGSNLGNTFKPGVLQGRPATYQMLSKDTKAFKTDWNNVAPSIGAAWTTGASGGWLRKVFGAPGDSVIRAGYSMSYQRGGMNDYTEILGGNPGVQIDATRNLTNGNLGALPVLLRSSDLSAPSMNLTRQYPMTVPSASSNVRIFDPNIQVPWSESYQIGLQRALSKNWMTEARFIHTAGHDRWTLGDLNRLNYNEINIVENNFLNEFRLAQANLVANIAAGQGNTFKYTGAPGTVPLPIFLANLSGSSKTTDPKAYTGSGWTNSTLVQSLYALNPNPQIAANNLRTNAAYYKNMTAAGLPANFWVANPEVSSADVATNGPDTRYNGVQLLLNRRFADGYQIQLNYSFGRGYQQDFYSLRKPYVEREQTYTNSSAASGGIRHAVQANWLFDLPFGQGRRFASGAGPLLHRLIGGWSVMGTARLQTGRLLDFGNVRLVGFTEKDLQKMFKLRMVTDPNNQYRTLTFILPQDVIDNTRKAFNVNATGYAGEAPTGRYFAPANGPACLEVAGTSTNARIGSASGYGDCGSRSVVVQGPKVLRVDLTVSKVVPVAGRFRGEFQLQVFNVFNRVNFNPVTWSTSSGMGPTVEDAYWVTGAVDQARTMQMAFRISF
jgi:hypothetical protein